MTGAFIPYSEALRKLESRLRATKTEIAMWVFMDELTAWVKDDALPTPIFRSLGYDSAPPETFSGLVNTSHLVNYPILLQILAWGKLKYRLWPSGEFSRFGNESRYIQKPFLVLTNIFFNKPEIETFKPVNRWLTYSQFDDLLKERIEDGEERTEFIEQFDPVNPVSLFAENFEHAIFMKDFVLRALEELYPAAENENSLELAKSLSHLGGSAKEKPRPRQNQLHQLIWDVYCQLRHEHPTAQEIWNELRFRRGKYDNSSIIITVDDKSIVWSSPYRKNRPLHRTSLDSLLCRLKHNNICG